MTKGDIVLITFPFTNLKGRKRRPAVILYEGNLDVIVAFITSKINSEENHDLLIAPDEENGLKKLSLIRLNKVATLETDLISGKIGEINKIQMLDLNTKLKTLFGID